MLNQHKLFYLECVCVCFGLRLGGGGFQLHFGFSVYYSYVEKTCLLLVFSFFSFTCLA